MMPLASFNGEEDGFQETLQLGGDDDDDGGGDDDDNMLLYVYEIRPGELSF